MPENKKVQEGEKSSLHPRNKHRNRYDFKPLIKSCPELAPFVQLNKFKDESIDFTDPKAVLMLNTALLKHHYGVLRWGVPTGYLTPPIPGRADHIHHLADLLGNSNQGVVPTGSAIKCLDIGVGANCIYPIIGFKEYGWSFVGSEVEQAALDNALKIVELNPFLTGVVELRLQANSSDIFHGIIGHNEKFDLTLCNPPFHASLKEARDASIRKLGNLKNEHVASRSLNFGGRNMELWCEGGEEKFVHKMIKQSKRFGSNCFWFSTLISRHHHLKGVYRALQIANAVEVKTLEMSQGNKKSRIVAWTFLDKEQQKKWMNENWSAESA